MTAYRIDEYFGAVTECKAAFFELKDARQYLKLHPHNNLGIVEVEIEDEVYNGFFKCEKGKI